MAADPGDPAGPIGTTWNPYSPAELADPYPFYDRARAEAPVFHSPLLDLWVLTRYDDVAAALQDHGRFSSENKTPKGFTLPDEVLAILPGGPYPGPNAVATDPPDHARLRAPLDLAFTPPRLAALEDEIRRIADELVDTMGQGTEADLVAALAYPLPLRVVIALFGADPDDIGRFQGWTQNLIAFMTTRMAPEEMVAAARGLAEYHQHLLGLIAQKRANPGTDITTDLIHRAGDRPFTDGELVSTLTGLLFAGHPTIACLIGNAALSFLDPRSRWEALLDDRSLLPDALDEVLRLTAPVPSVMRRVTEDVVIGGVTVPADARALLLFSSANRDEAQFPSPAEYLPGRENRTSHLTFAGGPHQCAGRNLARLEARIAYEVLLDRLPSLRLVAGQAIDHLPTLVIRGVRSLRVAWG